MKAKEVICEIDAIRDYKLDKRLQRYRSSSYVSPQKAGKVRLHDGDLSLDNDLWLDYEKGWNEIGMIVTGDLTVNGNILNTNINSGPFLVVLGNLKAKNLLSGGGEIYIEKNADIEEVCVGEYNDGVLAIKGELRAQLFINDDHCSNIGKTECPVWDCDDPPASGRLKLSALLVDEIEIEQRDDPYEHEYVDVYAEILPRFKQGLPLLRKKGTTRKKKTVVDWLTEVTKNPARFDAVPKAMRTAELCMVGLSYYGGWLENVPARSKTREVCLTAVGNNGWALRFVPDKLKDAEMCARALATFGEALRFVPAKLRTEELCQVAVRQCGEMLAEVPEKFRTAELCLTAVRENGDALVSVPEELRTRELCLEAMRHLDYGSVEGVPLPLLDEELCIEAVKSHGGALEEIPEELRTERVCFEAVKKDGSMIAYVPFETINDAICFAALERSPEQLFMVERLGRLTEEMCLVAVTRFGLVLQYVPERFRSERVCTAAVSDCDEAINYVPGQLQAKVKQAVTSDAHL